MTKPLKGGSAVLDLPGITKTTFYVRAALLCEFCGHWIIHDHLCLNTRQDRPTTSALTTSRFPRSEPYGKPMKNANIFGKFGVPSPVTGSQPLTA